MHPRSLLMLAALVGLVVWSHPAAAADPVGQPGKAVRLWRWVFPPAPERARRWLKRLRIPKRYKAPVQQALRKPTGEVSFGYDYLARDGGHMLSFQSGGTTYTVKSEPRGLFGIRPPKVTITAVEQTTSLRGRPSDKTTTDVIEWTGKWWWPTLSVSRPLQ